MPLTAFPELQSEVEQQMLDGASFGGVEEFIEDQELPDDLESALWLIAWSMRDSRAVLRGAAARGTVMAAGSYD